MSVSGYSPYRWEPLTDPSAQIRLLVFFNHTDDTTQQRFRCRITTYWFHDRRDDRYLPRYEALSYTWGDTTQGSSFMLIDSDDGGKGAFAIYITKDLENAIKDILAWKSRQSIGDFFYLWVDALCIDQRNIDERSKQVEIMSRVYEKSARVLIWPGSGQTHRSYGVIQAFRSLESLHKLMLKEEESKKAKLWLNQRFVLPPSTNTERIHSFFALPWWSRMWVVQEAVFGKRATFIFDQESIEWDSIREILHAAWLLDGYKPSAHTEKEISFRETCSVFIQIDDLKDQQRWLASARKLQDSDAGPSIDQLLWTFRDRKATVGHDKIYSLLGLANKSITMTPDYSTPENLVWCELGKALICRRPSAPFPLDHIGLTHNSSRQQSDESASWAADWKAALGDVRLISNYDPWVSPYRADGGILNLVPALHEYWIQHVTSATPTSLPVIGVVQDKIYKLGRNPTILGKDDFWGKVIKSWTLDFGTDFEIYKDQKEAFVKTLMTDRSPDRRSRLSEEDFIQIQSLVDFWIADMEHSWHLPAVKENILQCLDTSLPGWRLGMTFKGYFILVPSHSAEGDTIFFPVGSSTPFVIRPCKEKNGTKDPQYELVGRCYIHEFMDGQIMEDVRVKLKTGGFRRMEAVDLDAAELAKVGLRTVVLI